LSAFKLQAERGCVEDQPQQLSNPKVFRVACGLRLVSDTAALKK
jgi:hypothetical protein